MASPPVSASGRAAARPSWGAFALGAAVLLAIAVVGRSWLASPEPTPPVTREAPAIDSAPVQADPPPPVTHASTVDELGEPPASVAPPTSVVPDGPMIDPVTGIDYSPPPIPSADDVTHELPVQAELPQDTFIERREAGIAMIDTELEHLAETRDEARSSGDGEAARTAETRIARLTALRVRRVEELAQARAGTLTPADVQGARAAQ